MIISNISLPLLAAVDTALLGHLDDARFLGAVAIGSSVLTFLFWSFGFLRMGTTSLTARAYGANDNNEGRLILAQGALFASVLALFLFAMQGWLFPFALNLMDASPITSELALSYCSIRIYSAPATLINYAIVGWFIGQQDTRSPLIIMVCTNLLNILLDSLFILGLDMKSEGAAIATVIAEYTGLLISLYLINKKLGDLPGQLDKHKLLKLSHYRSMLTVNRHLFVRTACLLFSFSFFTAQGARQGDTLLAANAIILQLLMLLAYGFDGFAHAAEALIGKAIGGKNLDAFYAACRAITVWALFSAFAFTLIFFFAKEPLVYLFSDIESLRLEVYQYYPWLLALPFICIGGYQLDGIFIGAGKSAGMQASMLFSVFIIYLPLWWFTQGLGNHGLWLAFCAFNLARTLSMYILYVRYSQSKSWI
jgi:MATE family multidrug resistance protein